MNYLIDFLAQYLLYQKGKKPQVLKNLEFKLKL